MRARGSKSGAHATSLEHPPFIGEQVASQRTIADFHGLSKRGRRSGAGNTELVFDPELDARAETENRGAFGNAVQSREFRRGLNRVRVHGLSTPIPTLIFFVFVAIALAVAKAPGNTGSSGTQNVPKPNSSASRAAAIYSFADELSNATPNSLALFTVVPSIRVSSASLGFTEETRFRAFIDRQIGAADYVVRYPSGVVVNQRQRLGAARFCLV
jgi:hypothetical protein